MLASEVLHEPRVAAPSAHGMSERKDWRWAIGKNNLLDETVEIDLIFRETALTALAPIGQRAVRHPLPARQRVNLDVRLVTYGKPLRAISPASSRAARREIPGQLYRRMGADALTANDRASGGDRLEDHRFFDASFPLGWSETPRVTIPP